MPNYYDKITLNDSIINTELTSEIIFRSSRFNLDFDILHLRKNKDEKYEFLSSKSLLIPSSQFGKGDMISLFTWQGKLLNENIEINQRQPFKANRSFFPYLKDSTIEDESNFVNINCEIEYSEKEIDWINLGYIPDDPASEKVLFFEKDDKIFIYACLGGYLIYEGSYRQKSPGKFLIYHLKARKRNVEFSKGELINDFKGYLNNTLNNKKYIDKWSLDFMKK